jgi:DNA segregation ATPase FtsK/SpoIIIE, S-DNA-T family
MPSNPSAADFAGFDAAGPPAAAPPLDLAELAAALARIEALLAAGDAEGPEGAAAIERIADIAFVLHERDIEPSLCDALDEAVREISAADALKRTSVQRASEAAALLRELSHALNDMVAAADVEPQPQLAASVNEADASSAAVQIVQEGQVAAAPAQDELSPPARLFDAGMPDDDAFALTVAALAQALPEGAGTAPADWRHQMAEPAAPAETSTHPENAPDQETTEAPQSEEVVVSHSSAEGNLHEPMPGELAATAAEDAGLGAEAGAHTVLPEVFLNEPAAAPDGDVVLSESSFAAVEDAEQAPAIENVELAQPDTMTADALPQAPAEESAGTTASEPAAVMAAAMAEEAAPDHVVLDQSIERQPATVCAAVDHEQEPAVPELAEGESMDAVAPVAARDEASAQREQGAERDEVAPEPMAPPPFIDPDEDPGDLFEPAADARALSVARAAAALAAAGTNGEAAPASIAIATLAPAPAAAAIVAAETPQAASALRLPPVAPTTHVAPRPPASDPLAPIRALSEEELIALFS